ncbi:MAG: hypothetical protein KGJ52_05135, partial [Gammaproteobacteria bacterium]|nr:hypothetical protein [Gammaproteobacteria bacterium]
IVGLNGSASPSLQWRVEAYDKRWDHPAPYLENLLGGQTLLPDLSPDRVAIRPTSARAWGVEFSGHAALGRWTIDGNITRSSAQDLVGDVWTDRSWQQGLALAADISWRIPSWTLGATIHWHSGWPRTPLLPASAAAGGAGWAVGPRNSGSWPPFFSANIRAAWHRAWARTELEVFAEVGNATNHPNPCCVALIGGEATPSADLLGYWRPRTLGAGFTLRRR